MYDKNRGERVDRCVILVTGKDVEQILENPILIEGKAFHTTEAIMKTINDWNISDEIVALCFDRVLQMSTVDGELALANV